MIRLYEKTTKTIDNLYGIKEIQDNPFLNNPCLLCLSSQDNYSKSVFGLIRAGMQAARLRTTVERASKYNSKNFPVKFLGVSFKRENLEEKSSIHIANKYLIPLVVENNHKIDLALAQKRMRNVNIISYCDGVNTFLEAEKILIKAMQNAQYSTEEINLILSQISLTALATLQSLKDTKATSISVIDVNDREIENDLTPKLRTNLQSSMMTYGFGNCSTTSSIFYYEGSGTHSIKELLKNENFAKVVISLAVTTALKNSIENQEKLNLLKKEEIHSKIINSLFSVTKQDAPQLMTGIDNFDLYDGYPKLSDAECDLQDQIDALCQKLIEEIKENALLKSNNEGWEQQFGKIDAAIKKYTSDIGYYQIMAMAVGYQVDENILKQPTDRELVEQTRKK